MTTSHETAHHEAQEALPWLANGSLCGDERERVQAHLETCALCRADLAVLHTLRAASPGLVPDCDAERALARLLPRLDAPAGLPDQLAAVPAPVPAPAPAPREAPAGWRARLAANDGRWLRAAVALQFGAIAVLAALLARPSATADAQAGAYRALGAGPSAQATLIVTFRPDTPERELRRIAGAHHARIVGGPTVTGAWLVDTDIGAAAALASLRAEPAVTLAEPLGAEGQP
jgi:hypothetical protein